MSRPAPFPRPSSSASDRSVAAAGGRHRVDEGGTLGRQHVDARSGLGGHQVLDAGRRSHGQPVYVEKHKQGKHKHKKHKHKKHR